MTSSSGKSLQPRRARRLALAALTTAAALLIILDAPGGGAAGGGSAPAGSGGAVLLESIPGKEVKRVILSAKAAERLGIETGSVREEPIVRTQMFGGKVVPSSSVQVVRQEPRGAFGGFGDVSAIAQVQPAAPAVESVTSGNEAWIRLALSEEEWGRVAQDKPARLVSLSGDGSQALVAHPVPIPPFVDLRRSMLTVYYIVPEEGHGLALNERTRLEVELKGSGGTQRVVPYSALYYDDEGAAWVYLVVAPLTYERQRVEVERIVGESAVLAGGPAVDSEVVTLGAPLLYGAEVIYKY